MADGGQPTGKRQRVWIGPADWAQIERATKRLARAFGYGSGWRGEVLNVAESGMAESGLDNSAAVALVHRGRVVDGAARSIRGSSSVRRQHAWTPHRGIVSVPHASPDPAGQAALAFAKLTGPLWPLLRVYALDELECWPEVERYLCRELPGRMMACRHAMARLMCRTKAIDDQARVLGMRASTYRAQVREAEGTLARWLALASRRYNRCADATSPRLGRREPSALRSSTFWRECEAERANPCRMLASVNASRTRDGPHSTNDINIVNPANLSHGFQACRAA